MTRQQREQYKQTKALIEGFLLFILGVAAFCVVGPSIDQPQYEVGHGMARESRGTK